MYPEPSKTIPVEVLHGHSLAAEALSSARPWRRSPVGTVVGYARTLRDPDDVRRAVVELGRLGVRSENIFLDRPGKETEAGLRLALEALDEGDQFMVAGLARLARSLAGLARIADQIAERGAQLVIAGERFSSLTPVNLLHLLAQFQVDLVDWSLEDAEWVHQQRQDERHPHHRLDAVQSVWLRELLDAGLPRNQLGEHFGVSRATLFRAAAL